jgi:DNA/RNA-binding domain of Phe-tRNA-synthetase-like protein
MFKIIVSEKITAACPEFRGAAFYARVKNGAYNAELWGEIQSCIAQYIESHTLGTVKSNSAIAATRLAYRKLGKEPNRYRPSAEALCRRIVKGMPLYQINTVVDAINLLSIRTGLSIGGFDAAKIRGDTLTLGVGEEGEPFQAIGRGELNIAGLPVYRDAYGPIGTPTSDEERTKLDTGSSQLLAIVNGYSGQEDLDKGVSYLKLLMERFAEAEEVEVSYFS